MPSLPPNSPSSRPGCPTGCGCSGFFIALLLWTPALVISRLNSGAGNASIGITLLVSLPVALLMLVAAKVSLGGIAPSDVKEHRRPHILFAISYLLTFLICIFATFFIGRAAQ